MIKPTYVLRRLDRLLCLLFTFKPLIEDLSLLHRLQASL